MLKELIFTFLILGTVYNQTLTGASGVSGCSGNLTATPSQTFTTDAGSNTITYAYTKVAQGSSDTPVVVASQTTSTFDSSAVAANGTWTIAVTMSATGATTETVSADITLTTCQPTLAGASGVSGCSGNLTATPSATFTTAAGQNTITYAYTKVAQGSSDTPVVVASQTTSTFDSSTVAANGTWTIEVTMSATGATTETVSADITLTTCVATLVGTITNCAGTLTATASAAMTAAAGNNALTYAYTKVATGTTDTPVAVTGQTTSSFDSSVIAENGNWTVEVSINYTGGTAETASKAITLASCPTPASLTGTATGCTGTLTATPSSVLSTAAGSNAITYAYTYAAASGSPTAITGQTTSSLDVSKIATDGSWTVEVSMSYTGNANPETTTKDITLSGCAAGTDDDDDDDSANVLGLFALLLLALVF